MKATNIEFKGLKRDGLSIKKGYIILPSYATNIANESEYITIYTKIHNKAELYDICFLNNLRFIVSNEYMVIYLPIESITSFGTN